MKFRTAWYREQQQQRDLIERERISKTRKRRPPTSVPEIWDRLENISVKLNQVLQELFETMRQPSAPGGLTPELSISLIADVEELPPEIEVAPARQRPVTLRGRHKIVAGGRIEEHAVITKIEVVARAVLYGLPGEAPPHEMTRLTWFLPLESREKQEKHREIEQDGK
jgi:hypothetical protein